MTANEALLVKLEKLHELMKKGVISAEEFEVKKAEMLKLIYNNEQLFTKLEKLHELRGMGIITAEEFEANKLELLKKLL